MSYITDLDLGLCANIASNFNYLNDLDNFCVLFSDMCKDQIFWIEMLKNRFPEYHVQKPKNTYDYKFLYRELLKHTTNVYRSI